MLLVCAILANVLLTPSIALQCYTDLNYRMANCSSSSICAWICDRSTMRVTSRFCQNMDIPMLNCSTTCLNGIYRNQSVIVCCCMEDYCNSAETCLSNDDRPKSLETKSSSSSTAQVVVPIVIAVGILCAILLIALICLLRRRWKRKKREKERKKRWEEKFGINGKEDNGYDPHIPVPEVPSLPRIARMPESPPYPGRVTFELDIEQEVDITLTGMKAEDGDEQCLIDEYETQELSDISSTQQSDAMTEKSTMESQTKTSQPSLVSTQMSEWRERM